MAQDEDDSVLADSTTLLSTTSPSMSPIKRPARTYGRPKNASVSDESNSSFQPAWAPSSTTYGVATSNLVEKIPNKSYLSRQSLQPDVADDQASDGEAGDASGSFQFSWKAKLKEVDEIEGDDSGVRDAEDASHRAPHPSDGTTSSNDSSRTVPNSPSLQDVFSGSLSTITGSSFDAFSHSPPASPPPIASRRRVKQRAVVASFDEDSEDDTKHSARKPPLRPHPITSPKSRPSSTPPTSDDEMPARLASNSRSKGKGKPLSSRAQVPALRFSDEPAATHKKRLSGTVPAATKSKHKAPTKKELLETVRDRGRIAGGQRAGVQHAETSSRYSLQNFFTSVQTLGRTPSDDPISSFSSSPGEHRTAPAPIEFVDEVVTPFPQTFILPKSDLRDLDDDEEPPDISGILDEVKAVKTQEEKRKELLEFKEKVLKQKARRDSMEDGDDDLEIVSETKVAADRGSASKHKPSEGRKRQLALGGIGLAQQRSKQSGTPPKPLASGMTHEQLAKNMARLVAEKNAVITKQKEDEWRKRGGEVVEARGDAAEIAALREAALKEYAEKGQKNAEARHARMQVDLEEDEEDASDEDWTDEMQGSASSRPQGHSDADAEDADITMVNEEDSEGEDENDENDAPGQPRGRAMRRARAVIDSDSDNDEENAPVQKSASFILRESILGQDSDENNLVSPIELVSGSTIHRGSASSMDERTEDEGDKENNTHLMYDRSEDKENKAVPRHPLGGRPAMLGRQGSLFGLEEGMQRSLSMSPGDHEPMSDDENANENENENENENPNENSAGGDRRQPLQNLLPDEDPFLAEPGLSPSVDFATRLQQASPSTGDQLDSPTSTLQPSFEAVVRVGSKAAFSEFSDDESGSFKGAPLQPGFSDLFESGTEQQGASKRPLGLSPSFSEKSEAGLFALRQKTVALGLTQDVELQPAFEVGDHLKRQADAIFEKEQEYLWQVANKKTETKKQELYVDDHGFLTQTRPEGDAEVYRPTALSQSGSFSLSATQRSVSTLLEPQSVLRRPLRTLSLTESVELETPERSPLRRLAKRTRTPSPASRPPSPSPAPAQRNKNAFDLLRREVLGPRAKKPLLDKSEFVAEEAQESDDDEMLGFGRVRGDDGEEEDGEDMDRTLETLVDDQEMSQETMAAERVLEKFQEHAHEDDLENEKLQQAVVQGELRKKRRNRGLGLDDSDEEDEEDEMRARKMRRGLNAPRIGSKVTEYAKHAETMPFFSVYRDDLDGGDEGEFAYLQETQPEAATQDAEMDSDDDAGPQVLTRKELEEKMRSVARREEVEPELDVDDVSWMEADDSDGEQPKLKAISLRRGGQTAHDTSAEAIAERERLGMWAKSEARTRNAGAGRASGRTAVTGQKARAKTGGGSLRTGVAAGGGKAPEVARRPLKVQASVLAGVASERSARFV
ncbi:hypothetical protein DFH07DRAFT_940774 [Mycena maculata]|uniref:DNA replication checkpoint mediator MRC1 domain-containing protein n=1 Tax=Mycena maculata TaxID=230809 RepID=A0AAD7J6K7_9AGAR|nr:hypothetical protein DFH07DRAFT_940774 [Mycena maculata]